MVWNHLAAIFFFSGPLFYIGLVMMVDPAGIAALPELLVHVIEEIRAWTGLPAQQARPVRRPVSSQGRRNLRLVGLALVVSGLLFAVLI